MAEITVVIPSRNDQYIVKTMENVLHVADRASEDIELVVILDGYDKQKTAKITEAHIEIYSRQIESVYRLKEKDKRVKIVENEKPVGQRVGINAVMRSSASEYMAKIDGHSILSENYFTELKKVACNPDVFVTTRMCGIDEAEWTRGKRYFEFALLDYNLKSAWWEPYGHRVKDEVVSETMSFMGTTWFCLTKTWWDLGGYDERLYYWGETGTEFALKTWLTGRRLLLHKGVYCAHLYRKRFPYSLNEYNRRESARIIRGEFLMNKHPNQIHPVEWLVEKFHPVPTWDRSLMSRKRRSRVARRRAL